jgi:EpsD family peptidyl-prolyl cis-trans isomerase
MARENADSVLHQINHLRLAVTLSALVSIAVLGGCDKKPGGQVVAVVDNEEITQQELRVEAETQVPGLPAGPLPEALSEAALQRVIDRNLLAQFARDQGLDRGPEYVARRRQLDQTLLATLAMRKLSGTPTAPTPAEVQQYINANPTLFAQRQRLNLDQIRFAAPKDPRQVQELTKLGTLEAIAQKLTADKVPFTRGATVFDTATVAPEVGKQIVALANGQVFDLSANGTTFISQITGRSPAATSPDSWTAPAAEAMKRDRLAKALSTSLDKLRKAAKINYDPAFKPKATK